MKIAFIADAHLISDDDEYKGLHETRGFLKQAWPTFAALLDLVNDESPDVVLFLGDLVDWFSPENVGFALDLVSALQVPWYMTPGNHDLETPQVDFSDTRYEVTPSREATEFWKRQGCDWRPRAITDETINVLTFDSSLSCVADGVASWINSSAVEGCPNVVGTHVPVSINAVKNYIIGVDPDRDLKKYVQSRSPMLYDEAIRNRISHVFTGHLHFPGTVQYEQTVFHMLGMSVSIENHAAASATIVEATSSNLEIRKVRATTLGAQPIVSARKNRAW